MYALYQVSVRQATISLSLLLAHISRCKPWESLWGSLATTPLVDFHHRLTACPSYYAKKTPEGAFLFYVTFLNFPFSMVYTESDKNSSGETSVLLTFLTMALHVSGDTLSLKYKGFHVKEGQETSFQMNHQYFSQNSFHPHFSLLNQMVKAILHYSVLLKQMLP